MSSAARTSPGQRPGQRPGQGPDQRPAHRSGHISSAPSSPRAERGRAARSRAASNARKTTPLLSTTPRWLPAAAVLAGPPLGALLGEAIGGYHGPLFALLTVAAAALATAAATPDGRWWVIPAQPPIAWLTAAAAELAWHNPPYPDNKAKAVGLVHATTHAFPIILAALAAMGLVIAAERMRSTKAHRTKARRSGGRRG